MDNPQTMGDWIEVLCLVILFGIIVFLSLAVKLGWLEVATPVRLEEDEQHEDEG